MSQGGGGGGQADQGGGNHLQWKDHDDHNYPTDNDDDDDNDDIDDQDDHDKGGEVKVGWRQSPPMPRLARWSAGSSSKNSCIKHRDG